MPDGENHSNDDYTGLDIDQRKSSSSFVCEHYEKLGSHFKGGGASIFLYTPKPHSGKLNKSSPRTLLFFRQR